MNPWGGGGMDQNQMLLNNPMALVNNLVGAIMQQQQMGAGMQQPMMDSRMSRGDDLRRRRSRSPPRRMRTPPRRRDARPHNRDRSRSPRRRTNHQSSRKRSPPADRPEHEVYIGNYPANYSEAQLRNLFSEFMVDVKAIRMKADGHKVFSFAEVADGDVIDRAIENMDGKEINGRRLRVRGSKKTESKEESGSSSSHNKEKESKRDDRQKDKEKEKTKAKEKQKKPWIPKVDDSRLHLVNAFIQFIKREIKSGKVGGSDAVSVLETCNDALVQAFNIPEDNQSLQVTRDIEDIFFKAVRLELKPPAENEQSEEKTEEAKQNDDNENKNEDVEMKENKTEEGAVDQDNVAEIEDALDEEISGDGDGDVDAEEEEVEEDDGMADLENCLAQEELDQGDAPKEPEPEKRTSSSSNRGKTSRGRRGKK